MPTDNIDEHVEFHDVKHQEVKKLPRGATSPMASIPTPSRNRRDAGASSTKAPASALEEIMRRKGIDEAWNVLEDMQAQGIVTDKYTVSRMLMKTVGDGRNKPLPSRVHRGMNLVERFIDLQPKDVDEVLFNALLDTCGRLKDLARLEATVKKMKDLKVTPSPVTLGILVKTYGQAGDLNKVLQVWEEMSVQRELANAVTYGCMIDACVKCGSLPKAVEIFKGMRKVGKHKNTILYTTLIKGYGLEKDLQSALDLFREMPKEGVPYNTITYNSILDAAVKSGDLATAESLLREMTASGSTFEPDLITFSTLLKGYCHVNELDKALQVTEAIKARGLRCDELVYNTLMDGCVKAGDVAVGLGLFEEMVHMGLKPSAITQSILARLYQRAGYEEGALEAVAQLYQQHGLERPAPADRGARRGNSKNVSQGQRSPGGASCRSGMASPMGSPVLPSPMGSPFGFGPEAPGTPVGGSPVSAGLRLPIEAFRGPPVLPLPHGQGYSHADASPYNAMASPYHAVGSPYSSSSACGSIGPMSPVASPFGMDPRNNGFCLQPAQQAFPYQQAPAQPIPAWPFATPSPAPPAPIGYTQVPMMPQQMMQPQQMIQPQQMMPPHMYQQPQQMYQQQQFHMPVQQMQAPQAVYFEGWGAPGPVHGVCPNGMPGCGESLELS